MAKIYTADTFQKFGGTSSQFLMADGSTSTGSGGLTTSLISTNTNAVKSFLYVFTASLTLTLPATPAVGDSIKISDLSNTSTCIIGRNGHNIMGSATDLTLDVAYMGIEMIYTGVTQGWIIIGIN